MSTHDYTYPRPWVVDDNREGHAGAITVFDANGWPVVFIADMESAGPADIDNGSLIAAAPDLLDALERLTLAFDLGEVAHTVANGRGVAALAEVRAAIAKAKGGAS